jgi:energy-coupling factor transporter transmembrane protein EcfT
MLCTDRPGLVLAAGLIASVVAALMPAGLLGVVPAASWAIWGVLLIAGLALVGIAGGGAGPVARSLLWLLPPVLLLTLPASLFAAAGRGPAVAAALIARALAAAAVLLATVTFLGPSRTIAGLRALRVPARLTEIVHAMLVSLTAIVRQVSGMQRARAARRASTNPWAALVSAPVETLRGFGGLVGALLLRSLERGEALERARRARGGGEG